KQTGDEEDRPEDADPSNRIGRPMKDLRHCALRTSTERKEPTPFSRASRALLFCETFHVLSKMRRRSTLFQELTGGYGAFSGVYGRPRAYFSNHSSSAFAFASRWRSSPHWCGSRGAMYSRVGTPSLFSARYISIDCAIGTRGSASPAKNSVGVFAFATSFSGESFQYASIGAFF